MNIRILLADDHTVVREGLRALLQREKDMRVVAEAADGEETLRLSRLHKPDVVVLDVGMPGLDGIDAARVLAKEMPGVRVVALSMHSDEESVRGMVQAGALGYVLKDCAFRDLAQAIRSAMADQYYLSPQIKDIVLHDYRSQDQKAGELTERQREVAQLICEGRPTKDTAAQLGICPDTVRMHRSRILRILCLRGIVDLTKYAIRKGWISLSADSKRPDK